MPGILLLFVLFLFQCTGTGGSDTPLSGYLRTHRELLDPAGNEPLRLFDGAFRQNRLFVLGENHGIARSYDVELRLIRALQKQAGIRYLLMETGFPSSRLLNRFLETGDTTILDRVFANLRGTSAWSVESRKFLLELEQWNRNLPPEERLEILGFDIEHQRLTGLRFLRACLADVALQADDSLWRNLQTLPLEDSRFPRGADSLLFRLQRELNAKPEKTELLPDSTAAAFSLALAGVVQALECYQGDFQNQREEAMLFNLRRLFAHWIPRGAKAAAICGRFHAPLKPTGELETLFAAAARTIPELENRVVSLAIFYDRCAALIPGWGFPWWLRVFLREDECGYVRTGLVVRDCKTLGGTPGIRILQRHALGTATLFQLNAPGSPFSRRLLFPEAPDGVTTDYFQYAVLLRNSPAAVSLCGRDQKK